MSFLKAEWRKLAIANYEVDPKLLINYLPPKTQPDQWNGTCYVSLVGFMFLNTKLLGFPIPFHRNFEEVNLRFYVRYHDGTSWKRGVVFIKELVPKPALSWVANTFYKEHYQTVTMAHRWEKVADRQLVEYSWHIGKTKNSFTIQAGCQQAEISAESEAAFITEHYWGYTKANDLETFEYEVTHPTWKIYDVLTHDIQVDFYQTYGENFQCLNHIEPTSIMLAEGSEITVEKKSKIQ